MCADSAPVRSRTNVPRPTCPETRFASRSASYACATVITPTPSFFASPRTVGSCVPGGSRPLMICALTPSAICR